MRYSDLIGAIAIVALIATCFFPWIYIPSIDQTVTGFHAEHTNFGRPGLFHVILGAIGLLFFSVNAIWTKRTNLFICSLNLAWAFRNFILLTRCELGECPEKRIGIYLVPLLAIVAMVMALLPRLPLSSRKA